MFLYCVPNGSRKERVSFSVMTSFKRHNPQKLRARPSFDRCCAALLTIVVAFSIGCNRSNPYLATQPGGFSSVGPAGATNTLNGSLWQNPVGGAPGGNPDLAMQTAALSQMQELERRVRLLDENNRQLTSQIAQVQQQSYLYKERADLLQTQLQTASRQLEQARVATQRSQQDILAAKTEVSGLQASIQSRGGASLVANSSLQKTADSISTSGFPAVVDGRVIRVSIPSDQLLQGDTAQLLPNASAVLDRLAAKLAQSVGRNRIGIEGHTDTAAANGANMHQVAAIQAAAVLDYLQRRNQFAPGQLFSVAHGPNHPVADNTSSAGRAQNRRIEFVIYSDTI
jgi:chemotaxis protein MotB